MNARELFRHLHAEHASDETIEQFFKYHLENQKIWKHFEAVALKEIENGATRISAKAIVEAMRKQHEIEKRFGEFKINNSYAPYYARMFIVKYPIYSNLIETRQITGLKKAA